MSMEVFTKIFTDKIKRVFLCNLSTEVDVHWWYKNQPELQVNIIIKDIVFTLDQLKEIEKSLELVLPPLLHEHKYSHNVVKGGFKYGGFRYFNKIENPYFETGEEK